MKHNIVRTDERDVTYRFSVRKMNRKARQEYYQWRRDAEKEILEKAQAEEWTNLDVDQAFEDFKYDILIKLIDGVEGYEDLEELSPHEVTFLLGKAVDFLQGAGPREKPSVTQSVGENLLNGQKATSPSSPTSVL